MDFIYLCRDHGGPWQRDKERKDHLPEEEAMRLGKISYVYDLENGFDLLHIDPTKRSLCSRKSYRCECSFKKNCGIDRICRKRKNSKRTS